jgi:hypothetical protein
MVTPAGSSSSSSPSPSSSQHVQQDAREARYRSLKQTLEDAGRGFMRQVDTVTNDAEAALRLATSEPERQQIAADRDAAYRLAYEEYHEVLIQTCRADSRLLHHPFAQTQWILARAVGAREFLERLPGGLARGVRPALTPQESELVHVVERLRWTRCDGCGNLVTVQQPPEPEAQLTVAWLGRPVRRTLPCSRISGGQNGTGGPTSRTGLPSRVVAGSSQKAVWSTSSRAFRPRLGEATIRSTRCRGRQPERRASLLTASMSTPVS